MPPPPLSPQDANISSAYLSHEDNMRERLTDANRASDTRVGECTLCTAGECASRTLQEPE